MRVLLITAHPDDECMFFTPTIVNFCRNGFKVDLVCLSTGDADGLGEIRVKELQASARILGIDRVFSIDHKELQDGMDKAWPAEIIKEQVERVLRGTEYKLIVTFDDGGVSGHLNHCSISKALSKSAGYPPIKRLRTVPLILKYSGLIGSLFMRLLVRDEHLSMISIRDAYNYGYRAMLEHKSQLVWFRKLYLIFSLYMLINVLD